MVNKTIGKEFKLFLIIKKLPLLVFGEAHKILFPLLSKILNTRALPFSKHADVADLVLWLV